MATDDLPLTHDLCHRAADPVTPPGDSPAAAAAAAAVVDAAAVLSGL